MTLVDPAQTSVTEPKSEVVRSKNSPSRKKILFVAVLFFGLAIFGVGRYFLVKQKSPTSTPIPSSADSRIYKNSKLGYAFEYPKDLAVYECPNLPCARIDQYTLRIQPLKLAKVVEDYIKDITYDDLYCYTEEPTSLTYCMHPKVEPFTNANNIDGYKVLRTKIVETYDQETQSPVRKEFDDRAYVFPITHSEYQAVLFMVETPSEDNFEMLDRIVQSYRATEQ